MPGYLVRLTPELKIDSEVLDGANSVVFGSEVNHVFELYSPSFGWSRTDATGVAGEYRAVGVDPQGIAPHQLEDLKDSVDEVRNLSSLIDSPKPLTKHDLLGNMMQSNIQSYFAMNDFMDVIQGAASGVVEYRLPSYGYFHTSMQPVYSYGVVRSVRFAGVTMDVPYMQSQSVSLGNDFEVWQRHNSVKGYRASYLENWIPEQHFSSDEQQLSGVSAAKLLHLASESGQKVFKIDSSNMGLLQQVEINAESRSEIQNALYAGKTVTIHDNPIEHNGWVGSGYVITDETTGSAAYLISGGKNGGGLVDAIMAAVAAILGFVDGSLEYLSKIDKVWFSKNLQYLKNLARMSAIAGWLGLAAGVVNAVNGGASGWDLVGQIAINVFAFAATMILVAAVAAATGPILGAILGAAIAAGITMLTTRFSQLYF